MIKTGLRSPHRPPPGLYRGVRCDEEEDSQACRGLEGRYRYQVWQHPLSPPR